METTKRKKCPKCKKGQLDVRISRAWPVKVFLFWLPIKRYRCDNCYRKTYIIGSVYEHTDSKSLTTV